MISSPNDGILRFGGGPQDTDAPSNASDVSTMVQTFFQWVGTIWVEQNRVPTSPEELAQFDMHSLIPGYHAYIGAGGRVDTEHGLTLEQTWLMAQLPIREPFVCVINRLQPHTPCERITRKEFMDGHQIIELMRSVFRAPLDARARVDLRNSETLSTIVYDGDRVAHVITTLGIDAATSSFVYLDPWPGRSLLCAENNAAGVAATPVPSGERLWMLKPKELEAVLFSVLVPLNLWLQKPK
jgi:hypothetical protein